MQSKSGQRWKKENSKKKNKWHLLLLFSPAVYWKGRTSFLQKSRALISILTAFSHVVNEIVTSLPMISSFSCLFLASSGTAVNALKNYWSYCHLHIWKLTHFSNKVEILFIFFRVYKNNELHYQAGFLVIN